MRSAKTRPFLTALAILAASPLLWAQAQRPAATRAVPLDLICAPHASFSEPPQAMRIVGGIEPAKALFSAGDTVLINAGAAQGLRTGQQFFARRVVQDRFIGPTAETGPRSIHTAGWLTLTDVRDDVSMARVSESCDGVIEGDYLEPFELPAVAAALAPGEPDYDRPARVLFGDDRRHLGAGGGSLLVMDRGSDGGLRAGQRLTIFRHTLDGAGPVIAIGEAFVASTRPDTSVMRIETSREEIKVGDLIAIHR